MLGTEEEQGKMFGFSEGLKGLFGTITSFVVLAFFARATSEAGGLQYALIFYGVIYTICGLLCLWLLDDNVQVNKVEKSGEKEESLVVQTIKVLKIPGVWLVAAFVFCNYAIGSAGTFTLPYLTDMYGLPLTAVGTIGIVRTYGIAMLASPIGGLLGDKYGRPLMAKFGILSGIITYGIYYVLTPNPSFLVFVVALMMVATFAGFILRGSYFSIMGDAGIPVAATGTAIGFISLVGYLPDTFIYKLIGKWIDESSKAGSNAGGIEAYQKIFILCTILGIIAITITQIISVMAKKKQEEARTSKKLIKRG